MKRTFLTSILYLILLNIVQAQQQTDTLNIFFDIGKSAIDSNNAKLLDKLVFDKNIVSIHIYGYTDFVGNTKPNQQLSRNRSENVRNYLINKDVKENIIFTQGMGVFPNSTEANRQNLVDKGIQDHRVVQIIYTTKLQVAEKRTNEPQNKTEKPKSVSIKGTDNEVCQGEQVQLALDTKYNATSYKWEKSLNNKKTWIPFGENTKTAFDEVEATTWYRCNIDGLMTEAFKITAINICCEIKQGVNSSRKIIYHDNFGIFSAHNSYKDAFGTTRPAKYFQTNSMPYTIPGHTPQYGTPDDGHYIITTLHPNVIHAHLRGGLTKDASNDPNGGVLLINVNFHHTPQKKPHYGEIYRQQIDNLCPNVNLYFEVSIANASFNDRTTPPNITISILTTDGTVLGSTKSNLTSSTSGWQKVTIPPFKTNETSVVLKIVSNNTCCWKNGVDLLMDNVIFRVCSPPAVHLYSDMSDTVINHNKITLTTQISKMVSRYYDEKPCVLYQVSTNGTTWKNISGITHESSCVHALNDYESDKYVYFRMLVASESELKKIITNADDGDISCKAVSVSDPICIYVK